MTDRIAVTGEVITWRKSSRSGNSGQANCVEVGAWRKSSRSSGGSNGANCVEAGQLTDRTGIALRDTKDRDGATFVLTVDEWRGLVTDLKRGSLDPR